MAIADGNRHSGIVWILLAVILQATAGVMSKYTAISVHGLEIDGILANTFFILAIGCLIAQALAWQQALKRYDLSFAYPMMSLTNFCVLLAAFLLFGENITLPNVIGLALISTGIYYASKTGASA
jgi:multidrug transporter EmrE-like cation transporter